VMRPDGSFNSTMNSTPSVEVLSKTAGRARRRNRRFVADRYDLEAIRQSVRKADVRRWHYALHPTEEMVSTPRLLPSQGSSDPGSCANIHQPCGWYGECSALTIYLTDDNCSSAPPAASSHYTIRYREAVPQIVLIADILLIGKEVSNKRKILLVVHSVEIPIIV